MGTMKEIEGELTGHFEDMVSEILKKKLCSEEDLAKFMVDYGMRWLNLVHGKEKLDD